eukprot:scaffold50201_cov55-Phaeocystis_antarctica.AAC.2
MTLCCCSVFDYQHIRFNGQIAVRQTDRDRQTNARPRSARRFCARRLASDLTAQRVSWHAAQRHRDSLVRMHHVCGGLRRHSGVLPRRVGSQLPAGALVHHRGKKR